MPVLRRTFDIKAERTNTGDWFLTELIETGLIGGPNPFDLAGFRDWQAYLRANRKEQEERHKWHDEPDVKAALARYNAETDPEKKEKLAEEWRMVGKAARQRLGIDYLGPLTTRSGYIREVQELLGHRHITTTHIYDKRRRTTGESPSHKGPF